MIEKNLRKTRILRNMPASRRKLFSLTTRNPRVLQCLAFLTRCVELVVASFSSGFTTFSALAATCIRTCFLLDVAEKFPWVSCRPPGPGRCFLENHSVSREKFPKCAVAPLKGGPSFPEEPFLAKVRISRVRARFLQRRRGGGAEAKGSPKRPRPRKTWFFFEWACVLFP